MYSVYVLIFAAEVDLNRLICCNLLASLAQNINYCVPNNIIGFFLQFNIQK